MSYDAKKHITIIELFKQGNTPSEIACKYGVTRQRIYQILKARGIDSSEGGRSVRAARRAIERTSAREARHFEKFGCTSALLSTIPGMRSDKSPYRCYDQQRNHAVRRGVSFRITFWEWWCIWRDSGKWEDRGRSDSSFCMCRVGDEGPYEAGNVYIGSVIHNSTLGRTLAHEQIKPKTKIYEIVRAAGGRKAVAENLNLPPRYISQLANGGYIPASWVRDGRARQLADMTCGAYSAADVSALATKNKSSQEPDLLQSREAA